MERRFLYFLPNVTGCPDIKKLRAAGLGHAFQTPGAAGELFSGPGGQSGVLVAAGDGADLCYKPAEQVWVCMNTGAWAGVWRDKSRWPGPQDLRHDEPLTEGVPVLLGDENEWIIPTLRFAGGNTRFPRVLTVDADGNACYTVRDQYRDIYNLADRMVHASLRGEGRNFSPNDHMRLAVEALKINYRIGPYEISLLNLVDSENVRLIADAALDGPNLRALVDELKKKQIVASEPGPVSGTGAAA